MIEHLMAHLPVIASILLSLLITLSYVKYVITKEIEKRLVNKKSEISDLKMQLFVMNKDYHVINDLDDMIDGEIVIKLANIKVFSASDKMTDVVAEGISRDVFVNINKYLSESFKNILSLLIDKDSIEDYMVRRIYIKVFEIAKLINEKQLQKIEDLNNKKSIYKK